MYHLIVARGGFFFMEKNANTSDVDFGRRIQTILVVRNF
jgi:hypothetical protein